MRNLKKVLALVIAFSMMLSVVAFAGYNDVDADADYAGAVELLSALNIIKGDDQGNFNPDNTITRSEMAAIICRAKGLEDAANGAKGPTAFTDVAADHWASGYVNLASQNGIIAGYGNGLFGPEDTLTYEAAVAMIVRALGFEPMAAQKGGWSAGYVVVANTYKITAGADSSATRANVAILMANAMDTPMMDQTTYGADAEYEVLDGRNGRDYRTLLTDMDIYIATGTVDKKVEGTVEFTVKEDSDCGTFDSTAGKNQEIFKIGSSNIAAYMHQYVDVYVQEDGRDYNVIAVVPTTMGETMTILSDDIVALLQKDGKAATSFANLAEIEYYIDSANSSKTKTVKVDVDGMEFNKATGAFSDLSLDDVEIQLIENDGDTTYDVMVAVQYQSDRVEYVDEAAEKLGLKNAGTIKFDFEAAENDETTIILVDDAGNALTLADFAEDDVVAYFYDVKDVTKREYIKVVKLANAAVTGTVDEYSIDDNGTSGDTSDDIHYIVIDGKEYVDFTKELNVGDEGTFYIGITGKVIDYDASLAGENYAYILEGAIATGSFSADQWELKLLTKEDGIVTYQVKKSYHDEVVKYLTTNAADFGLTVKGGAIVEDEFLFDDIKDDDKTDAVDEATNAKRADARLVTYKTDANGQIKELAMATGTLTDIDAKEYKEDAQSIDKKPLEDNVVIFNVAGDVEDAYTTDISYLVDESEYTGAVLKDADDAYAALIITNLTSVFSADNGIAIVTKIANSKDEAGEEVKKVTYVQNEEEGTIVLDGEEKCKNTKDIDLAVGTAFIFAADANGVVSDYAVVATIDGGLIKLVEDIDKVADLIDDETEFVSGYIYNYKRNTSSKGEIITYTTDDDTFTVRGSSYKYTFNTTGRNDKVDVSEFMSDVEYAEVDTDGNILTAYPIIARLDSGVVIDVYTITTEVEFDAAIAAEVDAIIADLPAVDELTVEDKDAVVAARAAYDALTTAQKALVDGKATLEAAEAKIAELEVAEEEVPAE